MYLQFTTVEYNKFRNLLTTRQSYSRRDMQKDETRDKTYNVNI